MCAVYTHLDTSHNFMTQNMQLLSFSLNLVSLRSMVITYWGITCVLGHLLLSYFNYIRSSSGAPPTSTLL